MSDFVEPRKIYAVATDPIYVGTGGYAIGRVDNTIVRDPTTNIPKIPGSSLAGTWRYYMALKLHSYFKDEYKIDRSKRAEKKDNISDLFNNAPGWVTNFKHNRFATIKCAGHDDRANQSFEDANKGNIDEKTGHCGRCIVCKTFGYSKSNQSHQGLALFSDLNILFFPVSTRIGVRWVTSLMLLKAAEMKCGEKPSGDESILVSDNTEGYLNLGWINFRIEENKKTPEIPIPLSNFDKSQVIVVSDNIISQIINANLEVRTSVSIDPLTGAAKKGALFTSEAIPRGTVLYGNLRIMDKMAFGNYDDLPEKNLIFEALEDSRVFYETLGIGGMITRGFGRMKIHPFRDSAQNKNNEQSGQFPESGDQNG